MRYLLSDDFAQLARERTGVQDPTFNCMKDAFWLGVVVQTIGLKDPHLSLAQTYPEP